ncbi:hypothetical protein SVAN01_01044 [Stagonosporopsis vannaccii]|nr:hypothetical protein SVAN01_01044 [Stagonosporopsis vannaccii]
MGLGEFDEICADLQCRRWRASWHEKHALWLSTPHGRCLAHCAHLHRARTFACSHLEAACRREAT